MQYTPDFIIIPHQLVTDESLQPIDRILYGVIYWFERLKEGKCIAGNATLAELCNTTPKNIQDSLSRLEKQSYIIRVMKNKTTRLELKTTISFQRLSANTDSAIGKRRQSLSVNTDQNKNIQVSKNEHTPDGDIYPSDFLTFWESFPKKTGKGDALRAWKKLKPSESLRARIVASVEEHIEKDKQWSREDGRFIPNPATFLNQRRFDDEVKAGKLDTGASNNKYKGI